jgi:hypothetical protein
MNKSTLMKAFGVAALLASAMTVTAQQPLQKSDPRSRVPSRVVAPLKTKAALNVNTASSKGLSRLSPAKAQSQQTEVVNEDFAKFTRGSESNPDTVNWVANTWKGTTNDIDANLTQQSGWIGDFVAQASGTVGLRAPGAAYQTPAFIATPPQDYSGSVTVTFRAKRWKGYKANVIINGYVSDGNNNVYQGEGSSPTFRIFGGDDGWQYFTWTFDCTNSNPAYRIFLMTYDWVILDDINVRVSADKFVAEPTLKPITNVTDSGFTINWETVRAANTYLIGLKKKVWTSDELTPSFFYDFEDETVPEGFAGKVSVEDEVGLNGTMGLVSTDTLILPSNNATMKQCEFFMGVTGPANASADKLADSRILLAYQRDGQWEQQGYYQAKYFLNNMTYENMLYSWYTGDLSNIYSGVRLIADNFPEGYKLAVDSVAITTNRPFDFEMINEPGNFYSDGENPGTGEGFIDWHVSSTLAKPVTSYRVEKLDRVFEPYDPSAEYYYAVIARRYTTNSTYTWYHAFQPAAPVAIDPTDVDERGAYTANWEKSLKATRYSVTNYGAYFATKDEENHVLIDEDFSRITSEVTTVTDPTAPESLGNDYQLMSFDDYTILPGWSGISNTIAQGYLGCGQASYYVPMIYTPTFQADNDNKVTIAVKAVGTPGDNLLLTFQDGNAYAVGFDASGNIDMEGSVPESAKEMCIRINSYSYMPFMLDAFAVKQNLKAGAQVYTALETVTVDASEQSYTFTGLSDEYPYYAYDVRALQDLDNQTSTSEASNRVVLDLNNPENPVVDGVSDAITTTGNNAFAKIVARYGIDGRAVSANTKGLQIVKLSNGKTLKMIVK